MDAKIPNSILREQYDNYVERHISDPDIESFREWTNRNCMECCRIFHALSESCDRDHRSFIKALEWEDRHDTEIHITGPPKKSHRGNGKPTGIFAGTLTMSSKDETNENEMCVAITKIMNQQTVPVKRYAWYLEYTKNELPHVHFIYETHTSGRIHQKIFKRYWKTWDEAVKIGAGHRGGYHKLAESETAYTEYIAKDGGRGVNKWTNPN